jgi:hypothetical protein
VVTPTSWFGGHLLVVSLFAGSIFAGGALAGAGFVRRDVERAALNTIARFASDVRVLEGRVKTIEQVCR